MVELIEEFELLSAFWMTIKLAIWAGVLSLVIGTIVAILRLSPVPILSRIGSLYVTFLRNTPLTLIIVFTSLGLWGQLGFELASRDSPTFIEDNNFRLAVLGLTAYHAAFICEALRSGVNTIPVGQAEAARSIGLTFGQSLRQIILPQAFRGAITPIGNTLIALTKNTTVVAAIGVAELAYQMKYIAEFRSDVLLLGFIMVAAAFIILTLPMGLLISTLSNRLAVKR